MNLLDVAFAAALRFESPEVLKILGNTWEAVVQGRKTEHIDNYAGSFERLQLAEQGAQGAELLSKSSNWANSRTLRVLQSRVGSSN